MRTVTEVHNCLWVMLNDEYSCSGNRILASLSGPLSVVRCLLSNMKSRLFPFIAFLFILCSTRLSGAEADSLALALSARIDSVILNQEALLEQTQLGLYVYDLTADTALYACGQHQRLRPASTQKLFTAVTALHDLGGDYCFTTSLTPFYDTLRTEGTPDSLRVSRIVVRGGMDPCFGANDMRAFVKTIRLLCPDGIRPVIDYDITFKDTIPLGWGWCWDDDNPSLSPLLYGGKPRFAENMERVLADTTLRAGTDTTMTRLTSILTVLQRMMKQSDNQYAESLFYQLGRTSSAAASRVSKFVTSLGIPSSSFTVADGSGLSLYNYTTPEALVALLRYAWQHPVIYRQLQPTLPLAGHDGTLRKRMTSGPAHCNVMAKTGTVTGVSTLAGYALAANGHMLAFAIMNQGVRRAADGHAFQDAVCQALCAPVYHSTTVPEKTTEDTSGDPLPYPAEADDTLPVVQ